MVDMANAAQHLREMVLTLAQLQKMPQKRAKTGNLMSHDLPGGELGRPTRFWRRSWNVALPMTCALLWASEAVAVNEAAWAALREGGTVALVNHALAPGKGDPVGFRLGNCATQRDLSAEGREQASRLGARFRAENVPVISVKSSRWCRTLHTAGLAFPAVSADPDQTLDPLGQDPEVRDKGTKRVRELIENWRRRLGTLVLVTHGSNISALTGQSPAEGTVVVLRPRPAAGFDVVGTIEPEAPS
jgi:phosphohistidine phosphatase SixA